MRRFLPPFSRWRGRSSSNAALLAVAAAALELAPVSLPRPCLLDRNLHRTGRRGVHRARRWVGNRLTPRRARPEGFVRNDAAVRSLGLSPREVEILDALASGQSNKELARRFGISPNTVKTHLARIYGKLEVERRVQAIEKARMLAMIP